MAACSRKTWKFCEQFLRFVFWKTTPYGKIFKILLRKFSPPHRLMLLCSYFVKFVLREIHEIVRYFPDKKNNKIAAAYHQVIKLSLMCGSRPKSASATPTVLQILSKSLHFQRNYSRPCEHRFLPYRVFPL